jgi:aminoglycoside phosphotransferase family enzyme/predicted kinase
VFYSLHMNQGMLFDHLKNPKFFGPDVTSVQLLQTHISYVALTGTYAYKVKKPVNFGFLDFSTLDKRKYYCEEELRLNRRLSPEIYLDVIPITQIGNTLELNGDGTIVEYTLKMKEFPQKYIMTNVLKNGEITEETIDRLCAILVNFYTAQDRSEEITKHGELQAVKQNIDENFEQTKPMIGITVPKETYTYIQKAAAEFFEKEKDVFTRRMNDGRIADCHGDLHSGNIVVTNDTINIFDCIEFNDRFRFCDVASDIAFLAMDLDYLNHPHLSSYLIQRYVERSGDTGIHSVLNFYKSYRAFVRGKVAGFQLNDPHIDSQTKTTIVDTATKYFELAQYYAGLFSVQVHQKTPLMFLVSGLTGTGKSTIARKIAVDYRAMQINTDVVRKELAGVDRFERHHDQYNTGLYDPKNVDETYRQVMARADTELKKGANVVLDATFQKKNYRELAHQIATKHHTSLFIIQCVCPDAVVKKRLMDRVKKKSISDGRWEIYLTQKTHFEPFDTLEPVLQIDTSDESSSYQIEFYQSLLTSVTEVI